MRAIGNTDALIRTSRTSFPVPTTQRPSPSDGRKVRIPSQFVQKLRATQLFSNRYARCLWSLSRSRDGPNKQLLLVVALQRSRDRRLSCVDSRCNGTSLFFGGEFAMNRMLMLGIAVVLGFVGFSLQSGEQTAQAGHGCHGCSSCACDGSYTCSAPVCDGCNGCHGRRRLFHRRHACSGCYGCNGCSGYSYGCQGNGAAQAPPSPPAPPAPMPAPMT